MLGLAVLVLSIGLVDSINPATVTVALYLASAPNAERGVASFTLGVFATYLIGGILLVLGPGQLLLAVIPHPHGTVKHVIQLAIGVGALLVALGVWRERHRVSAQIQGREVTSVRSGVALGAGMMLFELPTAFPYFAAIGAIVEQHTSLAASIALLVLFNVAFVMPLLIILVARRLLGPRIEPALLRWRGRLHSVAGPLIAGIVALVGVILVVFGTVGLLS